MRPSRCIGAAPAAALPGYRPSSPGTPTLAAHAAAAHPTLTFEHVTALDVEHGWLSPGRTVIDTRLRDKRASSFSPVCIREMWAEAASRRRSEPRFVVASPLVDGLPRADRRLHGHALRYTHWH
jgi:hypothetical protein